MISPKYNSILVFLLLIFCFTNHTIHAQSKQESLTAQFNIIKQKADSTNYTSSVVNNLYIDELKDVVQQLNNPVGWYYYYQTLATQSLQLLDKKKFSGYEDKLIYYATMANEKQPQMLKHAYVYLAQSYGVFQEMEKAISFMEAAEKLPKSQYDDEYFWKLYKSFSSIKLSNNEKDVALQYALKSLKYASMSNKPARIAPTLFEIGRIYGQLDSFDLSILYIDSSFNLFYNERISMQPANKKSLEVYILGVGSKAYSYVKLNKAEEAWSLLEKTVNHPDLKSVSSTYLSELYKAQLLVSITLNRKDLINNVLNDIKGLNTENIPISLLTDFYQQKINALVALSDYEGAYNELKILKSIIDSSSISENKSRELEAIVKYETLQKEKQLREQELESDKKMKLAQLQFEFEKKQRNAITEQEKKLLQIEEEAKRKLIEEEYQNQQKMLALEFDQKQQLLKTTKDKEIAQQQLALSQRQQWIYGLSTLAIILLGSAGVIFWRYRNKQKAEKVLSLKNEKIETLIRELHHRVKNNMQVISSLLSLQSNKIESNVAKEAFNEGINRVQAMGLIHQKLYLNEDITAINMKQYIEALSDGLEKTYGISEKNATVQKNIEDITLDIDIAVPLGLILNELLTNAYKYGMNNTKPLVQIKFTAHQLVVADNGLDSHQVLKAQKAGSFGMKLIQVLSKQIKSDLDIQTQNGTSISIKWKS
jgi:two-component sensor histidine kinase